MTNPAVKVYLDRSYKQYIPDFLKDEITKQAGDIEQDRSRIAFCGFVLRGNEVHVFMPRGTDLNAASSNPTDKAKLLFKCLTKYCRTNESFLQRDGKNTVVGNPQILPLITEIVEDFKRNGLYTSENFFHRKGFQGKTNWKKTVGSIMPFIEDDKVIYPHLVNRFNNSYVSNEITRIHASAITLINEKFGWLLSSPREINKFKEERNSRNKLFDIGLIKAELLNVFSDSKIYTLKNLLRLLESDFSNGKADSLSYGFSDFQYVWEHMLRHALSPTHAFNDMPAPAYLDRAGKEFRKDQKGQRVDIFLYEPSSKKACVIDAKYYDASNTERAPGWPDLVKQFFYAKSLTAGNLKTNVTNVTNYFIFPGDALESSPASAYVIDSSGRLDHEFPPIQCLLINPELIINSYVSNSPLAYLREELFN